MVQTIVDYIENCPELKQIEAIDMYDCRDPEQDIDDEEDEDDVDRTDYNYQYSPIDLNTLKKVA